MRKLGYYLVYYLIRKSQKGKRKISSIIVFYCVNVLTSSTTYICTVDSHLTGFMYLA